MMNKRKRSSIIWSYFSEHDYSSKIAQCCVCAQKLSYSTTISNLKKHLTRKHPNIIAPKTDTESSDGLNDVAFEEIVDESEVNADGTVTFTPKRKSSVWHHFERSSCEKRATCLYCERVISFAGGNTGNLFRHLKMKHPSILIVNSEPNHPKNGSTIYLSGEVGQVVSEEEGMVFDVPIGVSGAEVSTPAPPLDIKPEVSSTLPSPLSSFLKLKNINNPTPGSSKKKAIDTQLIKILTQEYYSPSIVDSPEFIKFVHLLNREYILPSSSAISTDLIPNLFNKTKVSIKSILSNVPVVCLATNIWSSTDKMSLVALSAHYFLYKPELQSSILSCAEFPEECSAQNISDWFSSTLDEWEIQEKVSTVTTDDENNLFSVDTSEKIQHVVCFVYRLNQIIQKGVCEIGNVVSKVLSVVEHFLLYPQSSEKLLEVQQKMRLPRAKLNLDHSNKWKSTSEMLKIFLDNQDSILLALNELDISNEFDISSNDWAVIKESMELFHIFNEVISDVSVPSSVTISKISILYYCIIKKLKIEYPGSPVEIKAMKRVLLEEMDDKFGNLELDELVSQGMLLDPRFKQQGFRDPENGFKACNALKSKVRAIIQRRRVQEKSKESHEDKMESSLLWGDFDNIVKVLTDKSNPTAVAVEEVDKYLLEPLQPRQVNPIQWWHERRVVYPHLFDVALKALCTPAICDSCTSPMSDEMINRRSMLKSQLTPMIVFLNKNFD